MAAPRYTTVNIDDRVFNYVAQFIRRNRYAPTQRQIASAVGISLMGVNRSLRRLADSGRIHVEPGMAPRMTLVAKQANLDPKVETL